MTPRTALLTVAIQAARAAGAVLRAAAADPAARQIHEKNPNDFVTEVDLASERVIVSTLLVAWPDHAVRSEESGTLHGTAPNCWAWAICSSASPRSCPAASSSGWPWAGHWWRKPRSA